MTMRSEDKLGAAVLLAQTQGVRLVDLGREHPALLMVFELDAAPVVVLCGPSQQRASKFISRLIYEHGPEWGEALLTVMGQPIDEEDEDA